MKILKIIKGHRGQIEHQSDFNTCGYCKYADKDISFKECKECDYFSNFIYHRLDEKITTTGLEELGFRIIDPYVSWVDYKLNDVIISFEFMDTHFNHKGKYIYYMKDVLKLLK